MREEGGAAEELEFRAEVLRAYGARAADVAPLLRVTARVLEAPPALRFPLADEACAAAWDGYLPDAAERGAWPALSERLVQLRFPVERGISGTPAYRAATRRGIAPAPGAPGVRLAAPEALRVWLHRTPAGRVPAIAAGAREDFVTLVQALARRNEPEPVPPTMGACMVSGLNNWDRVRALERERPGGVSAAPRELYQDRILLVGPGPYAGVPPECAGLSAGAWEEASRAIRIAHESTHYFILRCSGVVGRGVHDELVADAAGIVAAAGELRTGWLLRCLGADSPAQGRLRRCPGVAGLSAAALRVLAALLRGAAAGMERMELAPLARPHDPAAWGRTLGVLASRSIEELAHPEGRVR
ncbi:MAG TPA: hypothetical protein VF584_20440 [Longimicrobium sp.]